MGCSLPRPSGIPCVPFGESDTAFAREHVTWGQAPMATPAGGTVTRVQPSAFGCITIPFLLIALIPLGYGARAQWSNRTLLRDGEVVEGRVIELDYVPGNNKVTEFEDGDRGDPVDISGDSLQGDPVDLEELRGDVVVLNIWG